MLNLRKQPLEFVATTSMWVVIPLLLLLSGCEPVKTNPGIAKDSSTESSKPTDAERKVEVIAPQPVSAAELTQFAFDGNLPKIVLAVERGTDLNTADEDNRTALMLAALNGHTRVVEYLLKHGATLNTRDVNGRTALMYASTIDNAPLVQMLLKSGAEVDLVDGVEGFTALMFAAGEGLSEVIKVLLTAGANRDIKDIDGDTALDFANRNGHQAAAELLRR